MERRFIRITELSSSKGKPGRWPVSSQTIWRWVASGVLAPPVKLGPQVSAWPMETIEAHEARQAAAPPPDNSLKVAAGRAAAAKRRKPVEAS